MTTATKKKPARVEDKFADLFVPAHEATPESFNVLLYGPPGTGKTVAAATAPGDVLYINVEGDGAIAYARKVAADRGSHLYEVRIRIAENEDVKAKLDQALAFVRENDNVRTVVVDTYKKLRDALERQYVPQTNSTFQHWAQVARTQEEFLRPMRDSRRNLVVIAHEGLLEGDGERVVVPATDGKNKRAQELAGDMDVVAYTGKYTDDDGNVVYAGSFTGDGRYGKDRSGSLGDYRPLDLTEWLEAYRLALTPDNSDLPWEQGEEESK